MMPMRNITILLFLFSIITVSGQATVDVVTNGGAKGYFYKDSVSGGGTISGGVLNYTARYNGTAWVGSGYVLNTDTTLSIGVTPEALRYFKIQSPIGTSGSTTPPFLISTQNTTTGLEIRSESNAGCGKQLRLRNVAYASYLDIGAGCNATSFMNSGSDPFLFSGESGAVGPILKIKPSYSLGVEQARIQMTGYATADLIVQIKGVSGQTGPLLNCVNSSNGLMFGVTAAGKISVDQTITAGGTTGAQTINKPSGTVNFAAGASSLVVTNNNVTTSSLVFCVIRTNDATAVIKNVVSGSGTFTITLNAAATGETSVGFFVVN